MANHLAASGRNAFGFLRPLSFTCMALSKFLQPSRTLSEPIFMQLFKMNGMDDTFSHLADKETGSEVK